MRPRPIPLLALAATAALTAACMEWPFGPEGAAQLEFETGSLHLALDRAAVVELRNTGDLAVGPVELLPAAVRSRGGHAVAGAYVTAEPSEIATLNPGEARAISLSLSLGATLVPGPYDAVLGARAGVDAAAELGVSFLVEQGSEETVAAVRIAAASPSARTGDVVRLSAEATDTDGATLQGLSIGWLLEPAEAGFIDGLGRFVGYAAGAVSVIARVGAAADTLSLSVAPRGLSGSFAFERRGAVDERFTSDVWVHGSAAYTGTWGGRTVDSVTSFGNRLNVWDLAGSEPLRVAQVEVDARTVNDVKVRADGALAVITHEGSEDLLNGVTILDLTDPLDPEPVSRFTAGLEPGVHNVWVEGDHAYLVVDGVGSGLRVLDISNPADPRVVASYYAGSSFLHDVYVRDGLAFLSHWNAGLVVLDVGSGIAGGSPESPVEVSRLTELGGQTHNAWYWPEAGYVFVGEEDFGVPGIMHVVDARDLTELREVATYRVPGQPPHNFWLDEERAVLYLAWYDNGLRALDVSGELLGELDRQGREIASTLYGADAAGCECTRTWAPQLHDGLVWVSDMNLGLVALRPPS